VASITAQINNHMPMTRGWGRYRDRGSFGQPTIEMVLSAIAVIGEICIVHQLDIGLRVKSDLDDIV
jgi:hypothetical protein